jgi:hypothetical protein
MLLTTPSEKRIEYQGGRLLPEGDENDQLEDRYTKDSKVDHEFTGVIAEEQITLEKLLSSFRSRDLRQMFEGV